MSTEVGMVLTTYSDPKTGKHLREGLLERQLAACVQEIPIHSSYRWKGELRHESETLMLIKTMTSLYPGVEAFIRDTHEYDVPEIIQIPIVTGLPDYLQWIGEETQWASQS